MTTMDAPPSVNGSGAPFGVPYPMAPQGATQDITRSSVPLLIAIGFIIATAAATFHWGGIFANYERERSETITRLDAIEDKLDAVIKERGITVTPRRRHVTKPEAS